MSEIDLVDLGFKRVEISPEESGGEGFYYYVCELSLENYNFCLISNENDNTINGKWWVSFFEVKDYIYKDRQQVSDMISAITGKGYKKEEITK
tara:strand:+ start:2925 stop:3203 length:279 start_codon:yes stop_codon:yes gene_type:complete